MGRESGDNFCFIPGLWSRERMGKALRNCGAPAAAITLARPNKIAR